MSALNSDTFIEFVIQKLFEGIGPRQGQVNPEEFKCTFTDERDMVLDNLVEYVFTDSFLRLAAFHFRKGIGLVYDPPKITFRQRASSPREQLSGEEFKKIVAESIERRLTGQG